MHKPITEYHRMWHLLRCNLTGRKGYNAIIIAAVALAFVVALTASFMTGDIQKELEHKQRLLGPELALVPPGTKERGHIYLTKGPPMHGSVPIRILDAVRQFPEIESTSAQKLLGNTAVGDITAMLIAFDPVTDFMVQPWLKKTGQPPVQSSGNEVVPGSELSPKASVGSMLTVGGKSHVVVGRLSHTGSFMDTALFFPARMEAFDGDVSWILISLQQGISVDMIVNKLETNIENIEVIARPEMLKTINDHLAGVVQGGGLSAATSLVVMGALLVTGAIFALLVYERRREFGLLKAMGARNSFVFKLIIVEALVLGGMGATFGLALSVAWLLVSGTQIIPDGLSVLSAFGFVAGRIVSAFALTVGVGTLTALFPAVLTARLEPYEAIRKGE